MRLFPKRLIAVRLPLHFAADDWTPEVCRERVRHHDVLRALRKGNGFRRERTGKHRNARSTSPTYVWRQRSVGKLAGKAGWLRGLLAKRKEATA